MTTLPKVNRVRRLLPLTSAEVERMGDLYSMGPLFVKPIDHELSRKGWVEAYDGDTTAAMPTALAYRADAQHAPCLYEHNGSVASVWRA